MSILLTGAAGFIGSHVARALLARGETVAGIDGFGDEDGAGALKRDRARELAGIGGGRFSCLEADIAERGSLAEAAGGDADRVIHLAAHAGVRDALVHGRTQVRSNLVGHAEVLEFCRERGIPHLVYASTSAVYGGNGKNPSSVGDPVDLPISLYAATKRADELMTTVYCHLYGLRATGLRFFTVYGPWGRPDMAAWLFTRALFEGRPLTVYGEGRLRRDFTYVDDIVAGILASLDRPPEAGNGALPHRLYNLGNETSVELLRFIAILEEATGRKAEMAFEPTPPEDVLETCADITESRRDLGFEPRTPVEEGLPRFVAWYRDYHGT